VSEETPGARRRPLATEAARLADELEALPEPPVPEPPRRRGLGALIAVAALAGFGLIALDLWAFVEARFAASTAQGWIAATLVAALALALGLLLWREWRGLRRLARVESVANDPDRAAALMERDPRLARAVALWRGVARGVNDPDRRAALFAHHVLAPLDAQADAAIRRASLRMAGGVLVLPSALFDTLWFAVQGLGLIRRIAAIYGLAPGAAATWRLARRVLGEAGAIGAADAVAGAAARAVGAIPGLADAGVAGVAAQRIARIGALAKRACRPLAEG
jgi:putative membrane protein